MVVEASKEYTPFVGCGYDNEKVELIIGDGVEFVKNKKNRNIKTALRDNGLVVAQAENPFYNNK